MRCPNCGTNNPPEEQLTYCQKCGTELRVVCPRCSADNPAFEEFCRECNLELHPDRGHERAAGIRSRNVIDDEEPWLSRYAQYLIGGLVIAAVLWIPVAGTLRQRSNFNTCQQHLGKIAFALRLYERDNNETLPAAENWTPLLLHYLKDSSYLACPARSARVGYAFNSYLSSQRVGVNPESDPITFFEAEGGTANLSGDDTAWIKSPVHSRGNNVALLSGAVKVLRNPTGLNNWVFTGTPSPLPTPQEPKGEGTGAATAAPTGSLPGVPTSAPVPEGAPPLAPPGVSPGALPANPSQPGEPLATGQNSAPVPSP